MTDKTNTTPEITILETGKTVGKVTVTADMQAEFDRLYDNGKNTLAAVYRLEWIVRGYSYGTIARMASVATGKEIRPQAVRNTIVNGKLTGYKGAGFDKYRELMTR